MHQVRLKVGVLELAGEAGVRKGKRAEAVWVSKRSPHPPLQWHSIAAAEIHQITQWCQRPLVVIRSSAAES